MAVSSYNIAPGQSQAELDYKRKIALALMQQGMGAEPIQHWTQGAAKMLQAGLGGYELYRADKSDKEERAKANELIAALIPGGGSPTAAPAASAPVPASAPPPAPGTPNARVADAFSDLGPDYSRAISSVESGGRYDAQGPIVTSGSYAGDRAYGKHQVMGKNIPVWTKEVLGREMTPQEFLSSPDAQEAVFKAKFGQYVQKFGNPQDAASAWFTGRPLALASAAGAKDQLGTHVNDYVNKFTAALSPQGAQPAQAPVQMAQAAPQGAPNREAIVRMLSNRYTAPIAQNIASGIVQQQFKPQDYDFKERPDGTLVAVNKKNPRDVHIVQAPGGGQSAIDFEARKAAAVAKAKGEAEKAVGAEERTKQQAQVADIVTTDIDRALKTIDTSILPTTGAVGGVLSNVGGTAARDLAGLLDTVKANAGFDQLNKMRQSSPTGGALGNVTERELSLLQATIGNLEQSQTADQLKDNLRRVKNTYLDIVHGPGKGPAREKLGFQQPAAQPAATPAAPAVGEVQQGYRFKGGNPADPKSWEKVQ